MSDPLLRYLKRELIGEAQKIGAKYRYHWSKWRLAKSLRDRVRGSLCLQEEKAVSDSLARSLEAMLEAGAPAVIDLREAETALKHYKSRIRAG